MCTANWNNVHCPVCDETVNVYGPATPGYPGTYWEPPEGPDTDGYETIEYNCDCRDEIEASCQYEKVYYDRYDIQTRKYFRETRNDFLTAYDTEIERRIEADSWEFECDGHEPDFSYDDGSRFDTMDANGW